MLGPIWTRLKRRKELRKAYWKSTDKDSYAALTDYAIWVDSYVKDDVDKDVEDMHELLCQFSLSADFIITALLHTYDREDSQVKILIARLNSLGDSNAESN